MSEGGRKRVDERALIRWVLADRSDIEGRWVGEGYHPKRLGYILNKWTNRGWWEYGVRLELGWLTPEGRVALAAYSEGQVA